MISIFSSVHRILARRMKGHVAWATALALTACAPVDLLNATIPTGGLTITRDIAYGAGPRRMLDIYRPQQAGAALPVVVFIYGGSWQTGSRTDYKFMAANLARRGLVVVVPDYRLSPEIAFPAFLTDCADAVVWTMRNIADHGGDPRNLFLMGHSAGAYNVAMLALDPQYLAAAGGSRDAIAGTIGLAGPYDFLPIEEDDIKAVFDTPDKAATQPVNFTDGQNHPMLLLAGDGDTTVFSAQHHVACAPHPRCGRASGRQALSGHRPYRNRAVVHAAVPRQGAGT